MSLIYNNGRVHVTITVLMIYNNGRVHVIITVLMILNMIVSMSLRQCC